MTAQAVRGEGPGFLASPLCASYPCTVVLKPQVSVSVGTTTVGTTADTADSNYLNAVRVVTPAVGGNLTSISVYVRAVDTLASNQLYQVAVYSDNAGRPGAFINKSVSGTLVANSWNTLPVQAVLQPSTTYWLAYNSNGRTSAVNNLVYDLTGGQIVFSPQTFGNWPVTFPAGALYSRSFSVYGTMVQ